LHPLTTRDSKIRLYHSHNANLPKTEPELNESVFILSFVWFPKHGFNMNIKSHTTENKYSSENSNKERGFFRLLGYYAAWVGYAPTFRDNLSVPSSRVVSKKKARGMKCGMLQGKAVGGMSQDNSQSSTRNTKAIYGRSLTERLTSVHVISFSRASRWRMKETAFR
jgi:hypothetical protein